MLYLAHKTNMQVPPLLVKVNARLNSSEDGDGSCTSSTTSNSTLNENDPLLMFLRTQHLCIKGSIEEFYTWLVNEDIDCMSALKEAVSDNEYLDDSMKKGCGTSGIKGFKLKVFHRAVMEYKEVNKTQAEVLCVV